jgi:hypothetical protein
VVLHRERAIVMINVQLSEEDAALLVRSLEWLLSETRMEMADTDRADFREGIRKEKVILERLIAQLKEGVPA